jgi:GT2 family glycosyltransferase
MRNGRTKYYISLDDDAWFLDQDEIGLAIEYMELNAQVGAVAFDILSPDRPAAVPRSTPRPTSTFIGCGHLLRLSALEECGFYTPSPGPYGAEEKDLCLRLLDRRWDVHLLPGVHVWHDKSSVARDEAGQHRSGVCNDLVFALRRCPLPLMMAVLPAKIASHLGFAMRKRLVKPCVQGLVLFFRNSAAVWQSRKPVRSGTFGEFVRRSHEA